MKKNLAKLEEEGRAGFFFRGSQFELKGGLKGPGIIVQRIKRKAEIKRLSDNKQLTHQEIDQHNFTAGTTTNLHGQEQYWEAWQVHPNETAPRRASADDADDEFAFPTVKLNRRFKNQTSGFYSISGESHFYPTSRAPSAFGFKVEASSPAGILPFRATAPRGLPRTKTGPVTHQVTASWNTDSSLPNYKNNVYSDVQETFT